MRAFTSASGGLCFCVGRATHETRVYHITHAYAYTNIAAG